MYRVLLRSLDLLMFSCQEQVWVRVLKMYNLLDLLMFPCQWRFLERRSVWWQVLGMLN